MTTSEILTIVAGFFALLFGLAKVGNYVLNSFHNQHVRPVIGSMSAALDANTSATRHLTEALARTDESQRTDRAHAQATYDRMGKIIEDHETRISVLEVPTRPAAMRARKRSG